MGPTVACPQCGTIHALGPAPARTRWVAVCAHCAHPWPARPAEAPRRAASRCRRHAERPGVAFCAQCEQALCADCVERAAGAPAALSACCRAHTIPVAAIVPLAPFWSEIPALARYPLQREPAIVIASLAILSSVPVFGVFAPCFMAAYLAHVLRVSSRDPHRAPGFPDFDRAIDELILPLLRLALAALIVWGPWLAYRLATLGQPRSAAVSWVLAATGAVVFPIGVLQVAIGRSVRALAHVGDAGRVLAAIQPDYAAACGALLVIAGLGWAVDRLGRTGDAGALIAQVLMFYLLVLAFHLLGRLAWQTRDRVDWES